MTQNKNTPNNRQSGKKSDQPAKDRKNKETKPNQNKAKRNRKDEDEEEIIIADKEGQAVTAEETPDQDYDKEGLDRNYRKSEYKNFK